MNKEHTRGIQTGIVCLGLLILIVCIFSMMVGKNEPQERKNISVILYHTQNNGWESLLEGMNQAEDDFLVNINYITMPEGADGEDQLRIIEEEIAKGAEGILLAVCDREQMYKPLMDKMFQIPIVAVESGLNDASFPVVSADNFEMGKRLGEEVLADFAEKESFKVALLGEEVPRDSVIKRRQGLLITINGKAQIVPFIEAAAGEEVDALIALHKDALMTLTEIQDVFGEDTPIYGIGNSASTVAALDQGKIRKLVFQNEFNVGYLGVQALLLETDSALSAEIQEIDFYCVSREELYGTQYEQLLFPIVE